MNTHWYLSVDDPLAIDLEVGVLLQLLGLDVQDTTDNSSYFVKVTTWQ